MFARKWERDTGVSWRTVYPTIIIRSSQGIDPDPSATVSTELLPKLWVGIPISLSLLDTSSSEYSTNLRISINLFFSLLRIIRVSSQTLGWPVLRF